LFSFICLAHGDNVPNAVALSVDNNHGATTKESETNRPHLTIVSSSIGNFNRGACEDALRIEEVQASLLEGAQALAGIKADHHAAWQRPSCPRGQRTWIVIASGKGMLNEQVPPLVTPPRPSKPARTRNSGQDPPMPPTPSPTDERLRETIAKRMRMSHVYQPLMLMELLGHGFARQQPARPPRRK
jgi:hypothetical protein